MGGFETSSQAALRVLTETPEAPQPAPEPATGFDPSVATELDGLLELVTRSAAAMVGTPNAYLYFQSEDGAALEARFCSGSFSGLEGYRLHAGEGVGGRVWQSGKTLLIEDYDTWEGRAEGYPHGVVRVSLGVPLRRGGQVVGVIGLGLNDPVRCFTPDDIDRLERFAALASITLEHAELRAEAQAELLERQRVEHELRESQKRYRDVVESVKETLFQTDTEGRLVFLNQNWTTITGQAVDDSLGRSLVDFLHLDDREACLASWAELLDGRVPDVHATPRYTRKDASLGWLDLDTWARRDDTGRVVGLAGTLLDRTVELEMQRALARSEVQARTIIDTVDAVLWEAEAATGRNLYNSPQVERLLGYPVKDWLEHENFWADHVHPDDREAASQAWADALLERRGVRSEYRMIARDGRTVWFRDVSSFVCEPGQQDRFRGVMLDITEEKRAAIALENDRLAYKNLIESVKGVFWEAVAGQAGYTFLSPQVEALRGYPPQTWLENPHLWESRLHPEDRQRVLDLATHWDKQGDGWQVDYRILAADGQTVWVRDVVTVVREPGSAPILRGVQTDITSQRNAQALERDRSAALEMIARDELLEVVLAALCAMLERQFPGGFAGISVQDGDHLRLLASSGAPDGVRDVFDPQRLDPILGASGLERLLSEPTMIKDLLQNQPPNLTDLTDRLGMRAVWTNPVKTSSGDALGLVSLCFSQPRAPRPSETEALKLVSQLAAIAIERDHMMARLTHQANYDALTGLPNRVQFERWLERALSNARRGTVAVGVMFLDLDGFKHYNDSFGHAFGDALLKRVAERLNGESGLAGMVARFGGDEFAAVFELRSPEEILARAHALLGTLHEPLVLDGHEFFVSASAGLAIYPDAGLDATALQSNADAALYHVKLRGKNGVQLFTSSMKGMAAERLELESALRRAIEREEFEVHYQPQLDAAGRTVALEALLRWNRPGVTQISPTIFIPVAEESGLIVPIDIWVLNEACRQTAAWRRAGFEIVPCAVNITALHVIRPDFLESVTDALERNGLEARYLELELTEGVFTRDFDLVAERIRGLHALGVRVAIDDFGTGYSSLSYLKNLPVDVLKVDRSFIHELRQGPSERSLVPAIVTIARQLQLEVVAEGVESEFQAEILRSLGCDRLQGHLFGFPCQSREVQSFLRPVVTGSNRNLELQA